MKAIVLSATLALCVGFGLVPVAAQPLGPAPITVEAGSGCASPVMGETCSPALCYMAGETTDSCWSVNAAGLLLHRSTARAATLARAGASQQELTNVADLDLGFAAGPRIDLTRRFCCDWGLGVTYFGIDSWNASRALADTGNLEVPFVSSNPADRFDTANASYSSRLYSTEINLKRPWLEGLDVLAGFRWVELHERLAGEAFGQNLWGDAQVRTNNHLYGFQLGLEGRLWDCGGPFQLDGFLKAGIYGNSMAASLVAHGTDLDMEGSGTFHRTSFLGELGLTASYCLNRHWSIFAGYEVMWLDGVGLAGDSIAALDAVDSDLMQNGSAFYHGVLVGTQFNW